MRTFRPTFSRCIAASALAAGACLSLMSALGGCAAPAARAPPAAAQVPRYRVAVSPFEDAGGHGVGAGMAELLSAALAADGRPAPAAAGTAAAPAQLQVRAAILAFQPSCAGGTLILRDPAQACIVLDLFVTEAGSGRTLAAATLDASSADAGPRLTTTALPPELAAYAGTPMEQAIRSCLDAAAEQITAVAP